MKISFRNLSIRHKLSVSFSLFSLLLIILTFVLVSSFVNKNNRKLLQKELEDSSNLAIQVVNTNSEDTILHHLKSLSDTAIRILTFIETEGEGQGLSRSDIQLQAADYLGSIKVGDTGYAYVVDLDGNMLIHPFEEIRGSSVKEYNFVQQQLSDKTGYLEYLWENPNDEEPRKKVLYMDLFDSWGWIISITAYKQEFRSLVQIEEVRDTISQMSIGENGYLFVMDQDGNFLIHPDFEGMNYRDIPGGRERDSLDQMIKTQNGSIEYEWTDPETNEETEKIILYRYIPDFNWIIAASVSQGDHDGFMNAVNLTLVSIFLTASLLFLLVSRYLSHILSKPLFELIAFIDESVGTDYSERFYYDGKDELKNLADHFNRFLEILQKEKEVRKRAERRNQVLAQFPEGNPYPVMRVDRNQKILYANPASFELLEAWGCPGNDTLPDVLQGTLVDTSEKFGSIEYANQDRYYSILYSYFSDQDAYYLFFQDITERKNSEYQMLMSESVFHNTLEGIAITDPSGGIKRVNPAFCDITGYSMEEVIGKTPRILKSDQHNADFYRDMWKSIVEKGSWSGEIWNRRKNGEAYPEWLTINSILDDKGKLLHYVSLFRDISDIKDSEEKLRHQAYHDALTGLPNRLLFRDRLEQAIRQAERGGETLAVLFLDMDNFKTINDSKGHSIGDIFLKTIAERLRNSCRQGDTIARLGGDEFTILLPDMHEDRNIVEIVSRVQEISCRPMTIQDMEILPSMSIGVTFYPDDGDSMELLMKNADMAMYKSKQTGKGSYSFYNPQMNEQFHKRLEMENKLRNALHNREISLVYQPKVSAENGRVVGAEALIRWNNPDLGFISPVDFIPLAEESGLILELGDWVLEKALADMKSFQQLGFEEFEMAVNLSARQFRDTRLLDRIAGIIGKTGIEKRFVNLEITENITMEDSEESIAIMEKLYDLGVKISIDDFGTGYSSYSYLKKFRTHTLKIDKSFVDELPAGVRTSAIMKNMIDLGHTLNMEVVAEGVEQEDQYLHLKEMGCDIIQGYYFSRPLNKVDFLSFLKTRK